MEVKKPVRLIIAGGRDFQDWDLLCKTLDELVGARELEIEVVSGTARGADQLGERWAQLRGYPVRQFPADWQQHGKQAGWLRNQQMAQYATHCVCFWDSKSRGTGHMINLARQQGLNLKVVIWS